MAISDESVDKIVESIGGKENINKVSHCVTRLRFSLNDESLVESDELEENELVKGSYSASGQFQVVIGTGTVDKVYDILVERTGIETSSDSEVKSDAEKNLNPFQKLIKTLGDIFIPIIPGIVTAGLLLGLNNILVGEGIFFEAQSLIDVYPQWEGFTQIVNLIANTAFTFLPALIGWSAVREFGGNPLLGIILGLMLIHPTLISPNEALQMDAIPQWNLFGLGINQIGYQGQVLPVLVSGWILTKIELFLREKVPDSIQLIVVAPVALLVTGFLSLILIGPITMEIGTWITTAIVSLFENFNTLAGFIYAGLNSLLVVTGMHHPFIALDTQLIAQNGFTYLWPVRVMSNIAQGSAALGMIFVSKNKNLQGTAGTSAVSAYLGVTEPAMFGVNIRFRYPFIFAMIGAAFAGGLVGFNGTRATLGIGGLPAFLNVFPEYWGSYFLAIGIAVVVPFVLTWWYGNKVAQNNPLATQEG